MFPVVGGIVWLIVSKKIGRGAVGCEIGKSRPSLMMMVDNILTVFPCMVARIPVVAPCGLQCAVGVAAAASISAFVGIIPPQHPDSRDLAVEYGRKVYRTVSLVSNEYAAVARAVGPCVEACHISPAQGEAAYLVVVDSARQVQHGRRGLDGEQHSSLIDIGI